MGLVLGDPGTGHHDPRRTCYSSLSGPWQPFLALTEPHALALFFFFLRSGCSAPQSPVSSENPTQVPGPGKDPAAANGLGLPRNVLSERERRCEAWGQLWPPGWGQLCG